jgi:flagellar hook assembly protein FlgD
MGHHRVVWDGRDDAGRGLATGTYLVQLRAGEWGSDASRPADLRFNQVRKVAFVK